MDVAAFIMITVAVFGALYSYVIEKISYFQALGYWGKWGVVVGGNLIISVALVLDACYTGFLSVVTQMLFNMTLTCPTNVVGTIIAVFIGALGASQIFHNLYNRKAREGKA